MRDQDEMVRFSIRSKILLGFCILFVVFLITSIVTMVELNNTEKFLMRMENNSLPIMDSIQEVRFDVIYVSALNNSMGASHDTKLKEKIDAIWKMIEKSSNNITERLPMLNNTNLSTRWQEIQNALASYHADQTKIMETSGQTSQTSQTTNQTSQPNDINNQAEKIINLLDSEFDNTSTGFTQMLASVMKSDINNINDGIQVLFISLWVSLVILFVLSAVITWITSRSIVNPIVSAIAIAKRIAQGERGIQVDVVGNDETKILLHSLEIMNENIVQAEIKLKSLLETLQNRIKEFRLFISAVSAGDLTKELTVTGDDDLSQLGIHLNTMTQNLSKIAGEIIGATTEISTGLNQLESASTSQAASASEQATSVAEVSSVVEEIRTTSKQTLDKASTLGELAEKTHQESDRGKTSVEEMTESMQNLQDKMQKISDTILNLSDKTQQIGEITSVVSEIAKQSKMLALNAAIEAAKAGEVGKGFAVVAAEVKELAEKSQSSTDRVQKILQDIRTNAEHAVMVTEEGTKSIEMTFDRTDKLNNVMGALANVIQQSSMASQQIVAAVRQETAGIDQIVTSILEIDKVTNQFSAATEQTKKASVNLAMVAQKLKKSVHVYKTSEEHHDNG